jgi:hypothetical protein
MGEVGAAIMDQIAKHGAETGTESGPTAG